MKNIFSSMKLFAIVTATGLIMLVFQNFASSPITNILVCPTGENVFKVSEDLPAGVTFSTPGYDIREAMQKTIDRAASNICPGRKIVRLGEGVYNLRSCFNGAHLTVTGDNITIQGGNGDPSSNNSVLKFSKFDCNGISVSNSARNTKIENLKIDYEKLPFTQGEILAVNKEVIGGVEVAYADVRINTAAYPSPLQPGLFTGEGSARVIWSYVAKRAAYYTYQVLASCTESAGACAGKHIVKQIAESGDLKTYRFYENSYAVDGSKFEIYKKLRALKVGESFVQVGRYFNSPLHIEHTQGLIVSNVTVLMSPGATVHLFANEGGDGPTSAGGEDFRNITFNKYKVSLGTSANIISSTADGIHSLGNYAPVVVNESEFAGLSDDAVALNLRGGTLFKPAAETNENILYATNTDAAYFRAEDEIGVVNLAKAELRCKMKVKSAVKTTSSGRGNVWKMEVYSTEGCGTFVYDSDKVYNSTMAGQPSRVSNNSFNTFRGGTRILTRALIEKNTFRNGGAYRIIVGANMSNPGYSTVAQPKDIYIYNNTFIGAPVAVDPIRSVAVSEISIYLDGIDSSGRGISNVQMAGNYFLDIPHVAINIRNCDSCKVVGNMINTTPGVSNRQAAGVLVSAANCTGLELGTVAKAIVLNDLNPAKLTTCGIQTDKIENLSHLPLVTGIVKDAQLICE